MNSLCKPKKPNVLILTQPFTSISGRTNLEILVDIVGLLSENVLVISGNFSYDKIHVNIIDIGRIFPTDGAFSLIVKQISANFRICLEIIKKLDNIDIAIFYLGARIYVAPLILLRVFGKKTIIIISGSAQKINKTNRSDSFFGFGGFVLGNIAGMLEYINYNLTNYIGMAMNSPSIICNLKLSKYIDKIVLFGSYYINKNFTLEKKINERKDLIGFVGRLSVEKGILEFVKAMPLILQKIDTKFLIIGDGPLKSTIEEELIRLKCRDKVMLVGWMPHELLPELYNDMKFHVLPSYIEAFGGSALEAMACGAISVATAVGGIPDIIKDTETGFILTDNQPLTIANTVVRIYNDSRLVNIQKNARKFIDQTFSFDKAVERSRVAFADWDEIKI